MDMPRMSGRMYKKYPDELLEANVKWSTERVAADPDYFHRLSAFQAFEFLWIGCSDSRVPANVITGLGIRLCLRYVERSEPWIPE